MKRTKKFDVNTNYIGKAKDKPVLGPISGNIVNNLKAVPGGKYKDYRWSAIETK